MFPVLAQVLVQVLVQVLAHKYCFILIPQALLQSFQHFPQQHDTCQPFWYLNECERAGIRVFCLI